MATEQAATPDDRLAEALELAERRREQLNELGAEANERGLALEAARAAEQAAVERAETLEAELDKLRAGRQARESQLETLAAKANEAAAAAAEAVAARVAADDALATAQPLLAEAQSQVERLGSENRQLRENAAGFDARVTHAGEQLGAAVEAANEALNRLTDAAVSAIAPTAQSLRENVLALAQAVSDDGDQTEFLARLQEQLAGATRDSRANDSPHDASARQAQAEMVRRVASEASERLGRDVAAALEALR